MGAEFKSMAHQFCSRCRYLLECSNAIVVDCTPDPLYFLYLCLCIYMMFLALQAWLRETERLFSTSNFLQHAVLSRSQSLNLQAWIQFICSTQEFAEIVDVVLDEAISVWPSSMYP